MLTAIFLMSAHRALVGALLQQHGVLGRGATLHRQKRVCGAEAQRLDVAAGSAAASASTTAATTGLLWPVMAPSHSRRGGVRAGSSEMTADSSKKLMGELVEACTAMAVGTWLGVLKLAALLARLERK